MERHRALVVGVTLYCVVLLMASLERAEGQSSNFEAVSDIQGAMYTTMQYSGGWYMNLNINGSTGSRTTQPYQVATGALTNASLVSWPLQGPARVLVVGLSNLESVLLRLISDPISISNTAGVIVDPTGSTPSNLSSAAVFPNAFNAPYPNTAYAWNPTGSNLARMSVPFPVIYMTPSMAAVVATKLVYNQNESFKGALYWADLTMSMLTGILLLQNFKGALYSADLTMSMLALYNSTYCLATQGLCLPLGGFNVWASIPPMAPLYPGLTNATSLMSGQGALVAPSSTNITLVVSQINSNSIFHDYTQGSDSPLSGLIAMLVAMNILSATNASSTYTRQLAFLAVSGENWDYMGSRRLMLDMTYLNTTSTSGLNLTLIDQVIELGQIGRGWSTVTNTSSLLLHGQVPGTTTQAYGNPAALMSALQTAAAATNETTVVGQGASGNPAAVSTAELQ